ncbi:hypothetical protein BD311DRAFT_258326 [Dichomitus squalens]|uniref:Uncharacterized protein n=1 Tax=Dichomitus squalens TaxID=114155 RepID=A0A4Q9MR30_9APHY|nr:hypothetical protein BD311DRAFT_258326 [Dichomitus squalens]
MKTTACAPCQCGQGPTPSVISDCAYSSGDHPLCAAVSSSKRYACPVSKFANRTASRCCRSRCGA